MKGWEEKEDRRKRKEERGFVFQGMVILEIDRKRNVNS
jgi:hypothetical protein